MKTTILLFVVISGYITPAFSQVNRHRKTDAAPNQFQNKEQYDFGNYNFDKFDKFSSSLSDRAHDRLNMPTRPAQRTFTEKIYSRNKMPCFHPKSGDRMPCYKPTGTFPMTVFKTKDVVWGILW